MTCESELLVFPVTWHPWLFSPTSGTTIQSQSPCYTNMLGLKKMTLFFLIRVGFFVLFHHPSTLSFKQVSNGLGQCKLCARSLLSPVLKSGWVFATQEWKKKKHARGTGSQVHIAKQNKLIRLSVSWIWTFSVASDLAPVTSTREKPWWRGTITIRRQLKNFDRWEFWARLEECMPAGPQTLLNIFTHERDHLWI